MDSAAVARSLPAKLHPQGEKKRNGKEKEEGLILLRSGRRASLSLSLLLCFTSEWRAASVRRWSGKSKGITFHTHLQPPPPLRGGGAHGKKKTSGFFFCLFRSWIEMGKKQQSSWKRNALSRKRMPCPNSNGCFDSIHPSLAFSIGLLENCVLCSISHIFFWIRQEYKIIISLHKAMKAHVTTTQLFQYY